LHFGFWGCEVFFLVDACDFIALIGDELVQFFHRRSFFAVGADVEDLGHGAVVPGFQFYFNIGNPLGREAVSSGTGSPQIPVH